MNRDTIKIGVLGLESFDELPEEIQLVGHVEYIMFHQPRSFTIKTNKFPSNDINKVHQGMAALLLKELVTEIQLCVFKSTQRIPPNVNVPDVKILITDGNMEMVRDTVLDLESTEPIGMLPNPIYSKLSPGVNDWRNDKSVKLNINKIKKS